MYSTVIHNFKGVYTPFIGEGNGTPVQYSCLENPMDGGTWWAAVHGVARSRTRLSNFAFTFHFHALEKEMATRSSVLAWRTPGTGEPWWAAVSGVAQSWTRLKRLSSSSSSSIYSIYSYYKILAIFPVLYNICSIFVAYFIPNSLFCTS